MHISYLPHCSGKYLAKTTSERKGSFDSHFEATVPHGGDRRPEESECEAVGHSPSWWRWQASGVSVRQLVTLPAYSQEAAGY